MAAAATRLGQSRANMKDLTAADWQVNGEYCKDKDRSEGADEWVVFMVNWMCMPMGMRVSSPVLISVVRQLLKKLRRVDKVGVLTYVDDLLGAEKDVPSAVQPKPVPGQPATRVRMRVDDSMETTVWHTTMAGIQSNFKKSFLKPGGHDVVLWKGVIIDAVQGKFFARPEKLQELSALIGKALAKVKSKRKVPGSTMRDMAKITGTLVSMGFGIQPVKLFTRAMFKTITASKADEYDMEATQTPESIEELIFWATELFKWARIGRPIMPDRAPFTMRITVDAGPKSYGMRTVALHAGSRVLTCGGDQDYDDMWSFEEREGLEQVEKEMLGILRALEEFVRRHEEMMQNKTLFAETEHEGTVAWLTEGIKYAHADKMEQAEIVGDCVGAGIYLLKGGGRHEFMTKVTKAIWRLCVTHGISLRPRWIEGDEMCKVKGANGLSVDDLSRMKYAPSTAWVMKEWVMKQVQGWMKEVHGEQGKLRWLHARQIYDGSAQQRDLGTEGGTYVACPPIELAAEWVGHAFQTGARLVLVMPVQHSAFNATVERATVVGQQCARWRGAEASLAMGSAFKMFRVEKTGKREATRVSKWQFRAVLCDFSSL